MPTNILQTGMEILAKDLTKLPPEKKGALVVMADSNSVRMGMVYKINDNWHMSAELVQQWKKKLPDAQITISGTW